MLEVDENGTYLAIWTGNDELLARPRHELLGRTVAEVLGEEFGLQLKSALASVIETGKPQVFEYSLAVPAGTLWFQCRAAAISAGEAPRRVCLLVRDVTAQKHAERELARLLSREQLLTRLSESVPVGLFEVDASRGVTFGNDRVWKIVGDRAAGSLDAFAGFVVEDDRGAFEAAVGSALDGLPVDDLEVRFRPDPDLDRERTCELSLRPLTDASGKVVGAVGCVSDVTDRVQMRRELEMRATVDKLTSCLNREAALGLLEETTAAVKFPGEGNALIYVDVDEFKSVNDRYGHAAGDRLLSEVAERLRQSARRADIVGRVGGDEFIVICPRVLNSAQAIRVAERVAAATSTVVDVGVAPVQLRTSVGVAWTAGAIDADAFLAQADSAMYQSKRGTRKGVTLFSTNGCGPSALH